MRLDLTNEEATALLGELSSIIDNDYYSLSLRIRLLQEILAKCGEVGGLPPGLAARVRRRRRNATRPGRHGKDGDRGVRQ